MPCAFLPLRATVFRLAARLALGWAAVCVLAGPGAGDRLPAPDAPAHLQDGGHHWRAHADGFVVHSETPGDLDDDDERWKGSRLACLPAIVRLHEGWGWPASEPGPMTHPIPPRGIIPPCLRC